MFNQNMFTPTGWPNLFGIFIPFAIGFVLLELVLKGVTLWKSARNSQKGWFIALLLINSAGILPFIYLLFFQKNKKK